MADFINNLSGNEGATISETQQHISDIQITEHQSDLLIINSFILIAILILSIASIIKTYVRKTCAGCKRLTKCEEELKTLRKNLIINDIIDNETLSSIAKDVADMRKRIEENGTNGTILR